MPRAVVKHADVEAKLEDTDRRGGLADQLNDELELGVPRQSSGNTLSSEVRPEARSSNKIDPHSIGNIIYRNLPRPFFPPSRWVPEYNKDKFIKDLLAATIVTITVIPQGMAYSILAGLPPIYGLYTAIVPLVVYAVLGTSREIAMGPTAMMSLLTAATIGSGMSVEPEIMIGGSMQPNPEYIRLAMCISLLAGLIQVILWFLSADKITNFVSHSVLSGFTSGAGITIFLSQLKYILGQEPKRYHYAYEYFWYYVSSVEETKYNKTASILLGLCDCAFLYGCKWFKNKYARTPERTKQLKWRIAFIAADLATLIMIFVSACVSYALLENGVNLKIIGTIPTGMKAPSIPEFTIADFNKMIVNVVVLAILSYMESFAIGTKFADLAGYRLDNSQEMVAIGVSNVCGSFFSGYLSAGSFSRTAVNAKAGSQSPLSGVIQAVLVLCGLYVTKIFYYIPFAGLAAIIETSIVNIIDISAMRHAWKTSKPDFLMMFVSFVVTLFFGMEMGIIVGVVLSLLLLVKATATPHSAVLGKVLIDPLSTTESEKNVATAREAFEQVRKDFLVQNESLGVSRDHAMYNVNRAINAHTRDEVEDLPNSLKALHDAAITLAAAKKQREEAEAIEGYEEVEEVKSLLSHTYRDVTRYPHAEVDPQVAVFRFEARLYFANCSFFRDKVMDVLTGNMEGAGASGVGPICVVVDAGPINSLDLSAVHMLEELHDLFIRREKTLIFCSMKGPVRDFLRRAGVTEHFGNSFFPSIDEAMANAMAINREQVRSVRRTASFKSPDRKSRGSVIQGPEN